MDGMDGGKAAKGPREMDRGKAAKGRNGPRQMDREKWTAANGHN
jgi:hypothetical protein